MTHPPYRLETERLVLRCWNPEDAPLLKSTVDTSIEHLKPWMPWALHEPTDLAAKRELLRFFRSQFDTGKEFVYGIFNRDETQVLKNQWLGKQVKLVDDEALPGARRFYVFDPFGNRLEFLEWNLA